MVPALPRNCSELVFPDEFTKSLKEDQFLLYDSGQCDKRMVIFATRHSLQWQSLLPLVFALLPDKSEETCRQLFQQIKYIEHSCAPSSLMIDFERAMQNAMLKELSNVELKGCFFHFSQSVFRSIQRNRPQNLYETNADFSLHLLMLPAIAFVPFGNVIETFELLCENNTFPPEAQEVLEYLEDTRVGRPSRRNMRRPPLFPHELWNLYDVVLHNLPRTNNAVEGWHRAFQRQVTAYHPNSWKFIECLKKEQNFSEAQIEQYLSGREPQAPRKCYRDTLQRM